MNEVVKSALRFSTNPFTLANGQIVAALGSQTHFMPCAHTKRNGYRSRDYDQQCDSGDYREIPMDQAGRLWCDRDGESDDDAST